MGSLDPLIPVGSVVIPSDYWNLFDVASLYHDKRSHFMPEFDPHLRGAVITCLQRAANGARVVTGGVYAQTRGSRFETKAEVRAGWCACCPAPTHHCARRRSPPFAAWAETLLA